MGLIIHLHQYQKVLKTFVILISLFLFLSSQFEIRTLYLFIKNQLLVVVVALILFLDFLPFDLVCFLKSFGFI